MKPAIILSRARRDATAEIDHYRRETGPAVASAFVAAFEAAIRHIEAYPGSGSPRYGLELDIPGLRHWPTRRFPHVLFYVERSSTVEVWRVLHQSRDIPACFAERGQ